MTFRVGFLKFEILLRIIENENTVSRSQKSVGNIQVPYKNNFFNY